MSTPVTQNDGGEKPLHHKALRLLEAAPCRFARQGSVVATWRYYQARKLGPYYRLVYREEGRQRSVYLGRSGELVRQVRERLAQLQAYRNLRRVLRRSAEQTRASLRRVRADLDRRLRSWGLRLKGWEIRGWRNSPHALGRPDDAPLPQRPGVTAAVQPDNTAADDRRDPWTAAKGGKCKRQNGLPSVH